GGIIACNREVDAATANQMKEIFLEIVIAPSFSTEALTILQAKKNIRLLTIPMDQDITVYEKMTSVKGDLLVQTNDSGKIDEADLTVGTKTKALEAETEDLIFDGKAVKHVKTNATVIAKNKQTIGIGAGQMNRIRAAGIAIKQAGEKAQASVLASDAFFPMPDTVEAAINAGVTAIIQAGSSKRDHGSIDK